MEFKNSFNGDLLIEVLFVKGINDNTLEVAKIDEFLRELKPTRVDIGTIDRPPAYDIKPVSYDRLYELSLGFDKGLNIAMATKQPNQKAKFNYTIEQILQTLSLRPLTIDDINTLFDDDSITKFKELNQEGRVVSRFSAGVEFFATKE